MAFDFPSAAELETWDYEDLDRIYIQEDEDLPFMEQVTDELPDDYELFRTGFFLGQDYVIMPQLACFRAFFLTDLHREPHI